MATDFTEGGMICLDKPYGMSSFRALARVRFLLSRKLGVRRVKMGHAGTLDPLATGVLLLCVGKTTKDIPTLQSATKEYVATLQIGCTTPSFDAEHTVDYTFPTTHVTAERIEEALALFRGETTQVPPIYSACKADGHRAYRMAAAGRSVTLRAKTVRIDELEVTLFDRSTMRVDIRVVCGKGTYIRALARDIGTALGSGAYLTALRRTRVGDITVGQCMTMEDIPAWIDTL